MQKKKLYGTVVGQEHISFALDGFTCVFINSHTDSRSMEKLNQKQGCIVGKTTGNKYVYLYCGQEFKIHREATLKTWLYFVSSDPEPGAFQSLILTGGVLNKLYWKAGLRTKEEGGRRFLDFRKDSMKWELKGKALEGTLEVASGIREGVSAEKGDYIEVTDTTLELILGQPREFSDFSEVYGCLLRLCQFMAFRQNVGFDRILLGRKSENIPELYEEMAECFVRHDWEQITEKKIFSCITFQALGDCLPPLLASIAENRPKKPKFNIGFIPEHDKDVYFITSMNVREVCSALESEMELSKVKVERDAEFKKLVTEMKGLVKAHRDGEHPLKEANDYQFIFGTLDHMSGALADKIEICFQKYQPLLGEYISRRHIDELVSYRNTITHGSYMQLDGQLAETTFILMKLVYCCVLKRVGMEDKKVRELMERRVVS